MIILKKIMDFLNNEINKPLVYHNDKTYIYSKAQRKAYINIKNFIERLIDKNEEYE